MFSMRRLSVLFAASPVLAGLLPCVACKDRPAVPPRSSLVAERRPSLTLPAMRHVESGQLQALICNSNRPCCVRETLDAGTDAQGHHLNVITVSEDSCIEDDGAQSGKGGDSAGGL